MLETTTTAALSSAATALSSVPGLSSRTAAVCCSRSACTTGAVAAKVLRVGTSPASSSTSSTHHGDLQLKNPGPWTTSSLGTNLLQGNLNSKSTPTSSLFRSSATRVVSNNINQLQHDHQHQRSSVLYHQQQAMASGVLFHQQKQQQNYQKTSSCSSNSSTYLQLQHQRTFATCYSLLKRNRVPFVDFETAYPKNANPLPPVQVFTPFTFTKQRKLLKLLEEYPQTTFRGRVVRQLSRPHIKHAGRNVDGQMLVRHRGGGAPRRMRLVDYKRGRKDIPATVLRIEYCPGRSAHVALVQYEDGVLSYILAPHAMRPGDQVLASENANILPGNCLPLGKIPVSSVIHNVEFEPGRGGQVARAAGAFAVILDRCARYSTLKLSSTEIRKFHNECWASVGQVSNIMHDHRFKGKAGVNRRLGIRPCVRGNAQNPSRHPHGGGERAKSEKAPPRNVYSKWRQGMKTRDLKQPLGLIIHRSMNNRDKRKFAIRVRTRYKNEWCKIKILRKKRTRVDV